MIKRWLFYIVILLAMAALWITLPGTITWYLFSMTLWLPLLSLGVSLLPMLLSRPKLLCPTAIPMGAEAGAGIRVINKFPQPPYRCRLQLKHTLTGLQHPFLDGGRLPTEHCGKLLLQCDRFWVYDYLGLFRLALPRPEQRSILVRPKSIPVTITGAMQRGFATDYRPKPGGGFAENHELRLYRPGDGLNQIHWKLTAKTGKLMVREAMIPRTGSFLLTLTLSGTAQELDRKLGRLLWLGQYLLSKSMPLRLRATTGDGVLPLQAATEAELFHAIDQLLSAPATVCEEAPSGGAGGHYHIGGESVEA